MLKISISGSSSSGKKLKSRPLLSWRAEKPAQTGRPAFSAAIRVDSIFFGSYIISKIIRSQPSSFRKTANSVKLSSNFFNGMTTF